MSPSHTKRSSVPFAKRRCRHMASPHIKGPFDYLQYKKNRCSSFKKSYKHSLKFVLDKYSDHESLNMFRFKKRHIHRLVKTLKIPSLCTIVNGVKFTGLEGLCILLRRLCYPNRLSDLTKIFHRDQSILSRISNWMTRFIVGSHGHLLRTLQHSWMRMPDLEKFANITIAAGCAYPNIVGFIDGTARQIFGPKYDQKLQYSGYKKCHVLKYQSVVMPNGLHGVEATLKCHLCDKIFRLR